jgi:hypothetical protein
MSQDRKERRIQICISGKFRAKSNAHQRKSVALEVEPGQTD